MSQKNTKKIKKEIKKIKASVAGDFFNYVNTLSLAVRVRVALRVLRGRL